MPSLGNWLSRREPPVTATASALLTFAPAAVGLATVQPAPSTWWYAVAGVVSLVAAGLALAKSTADAHVKRELEAERLRLSEQARSLAAQRAKVGLSLARVASAMAGVESGRITVESLISYLLQELHDGLDTSLTEYRVTFLAYRGEPLHTVLKGFPTDPRIALASVGGQVGSNTPIAWTVDKGSDAERLALKLMTTPSWEDALAVGSPPQVSGQYAEFLRGPEAESPPLSWCRVGIAGNRQPIGIICVDSWLSHAWSEPELTIIDSYGTLLGLTISHTSQMTSVVTPPS